MANTTITAVKGVRVGHAASAANLTGATVVLFDRPSSTAVDVRGGWPGTVDTDSVGAGKTFYAKHAVFLTGGDVFGLKCAFGVQRFLLEHGIASSSEPARLPGVVGANIYDLEFGRRLDRVDYERLGYAACRSASKKTVQQGNFGAGFGATVGKLRGMEHAMKGGVGSSVTEVGGAFRVGALVVTNAVGNILDQKGMTIAGTRKGKDRNDFAEMEEVAREYVSGRGLSKRTPRATTIGVVVTDLEVSHESLLRIAEMAHDGIARSVRPAHGATDGDTLFCVSTAERIMARQDPDLMTLVGHMAATQVQSAVMNAVLRARPLAGIPSAH